MNLPTQKLSVCVCSASFGHGRNSAKNLASTWAIWDWAQVVATVSRLRSDRCLTTVGKGGAAAAVEHSGASFWQFRWFFRILRMFSLLPAFPRGTSMTFGFSIFSLQLDQIISIRYVWFFFRRDTSNSWQFMARVAIQWWHEKTYGQPWHPTYPRYPQVNKLLVIKQWGVTQKNDSHDHPNGYSDLSPHKSGLSPTHSTTSKHSVPTE